MAGHGRDSQKMTEWRYEIVTDQYNYEATIWIKGTDALNVTERGSIWFSFTSAGFFIGDDDGKEHKLNFEKKTLR